MELAPDCVKWQDLAVSCCVKTLCSTTSVFFFTDKQRQLDFITQYKFVSLF
jgi:hypothetical protein